MANLNLTLKVKLVVAESQQASLLATFAAFNAACNFVANAASNAGKFERTDIHKLCYYDIRSKFELKAQLAVLAIARVSDTLARNGGVLPTFRPLASIAYDSRSMTVKRDGVLTLGTVTGRVKLQMVLTEYQSRRLAIASKLVQSSLVYHRGSFYLMLGIEVPVESRQEGNGTIGVDFGVVNIATDSDGMTYAGDSVEQCRRWTQSRRQALQRIGTRSARRRLQQLSSYESNFRRTRNHQISSELVAKAKGTCRDLAIENLAGIRNRIRFKGRSQRAKMTSWAFKQLRDFIAYKAKLAGVRLVLVDPRNTSRTCPICSHCEKSNRRSQSAFQCCSCGFAANADEVGAINISRLGALGAPTVD